jgi:hypothetical protein
MTQLDEIKQLIKDHNSSNPTHRDNLLACLDELITDQRFLSCLRSAGVDNWEGYDYASEMFDAEAD